MAGKRQLIHPTRLYVVHTDDCAIGRASGHHRVRIQKPIRRNRRQLVHVDNVVDFRVGWWRHGSGGYFLVDEVVGIIVQFVFVGQIVCCVCLGDIG